MHLIKKRLSFQIVTNAVFSVDTFFWLSGFLVTALCIPAIKSGKLRLSNWYMYYVHREIRLLPVYGLAIAGTGGGNGKEGEPLPLIEQCN
jgi:peptidoglycan/LPS O-acetylase OafA/YrhL